MTTLRAVTSPSCCLWRRAPFRMLVARADHSRNVCARWHVEFFFFVEARTRLRRASATGHSTARPGQAAPPPPTLTASPAKCRAPTCCCQLASACRPLHVAFQAASRGRGRQGFSDPGGRAKKRGPGREGQPRRRWTGSREALRTRGPTKTRARRSPRGGAPAATPMVCTSLRKTSLGSVSLAARRCTSRPDMPDPRPPRQRPPRAPPNGETIARCVGVGRVEART